MLKYILLTLLIYTPYTIKASMLALSTEKKDDAIRCIGGVPIDVQTTFVNSYFSRKSKTKIPPHRLTPTELNELNSVKDFLAIPQSSTPSAPKTTEIPVQQESANTQKTLSYQQQHLLDKDLLEECHKKGAKTDNANKGHWSVVQPKRAPREVKPKRAPRQISYLDSTYIPLPDWDIVQPWEYHKNSHEPADADLDYISSLIKDGANLQTKKGRALQLAMKHANAPLVTLLMQEGMSPDFFNKHHAWCPIDQKSNENTWSIAGEIVIDPHGINPWNSMEMSNNNFVDTVPHTNCPMLPAAEDGLKKRKAVVESILANTIAIPPLVAIIMSYHENDYAIPKLEVSHKQIQRKTKPTTRHMIDVRPHIDDTPFTFPKPSSYIRSTYYPYTFYTPPSYYPYF